MSSSSNAESSEAALAEKRREVFVRNLPFDATAEDLTELFQEIGPIKRSVIVSKDGVSRGFGFVKFALEEDAATAIRELNGREVKGRRMVLETALNRGVTPQASGDKRGNPSDSQSDDKAVANGKPGAKSSTGLAPSSSSSAVEGAGAAAGSGSSKPRTELAAARRCGVLVFGVPQDVGKKAFRKYMKSVSKKAKLQVVTQDNFIYPEIDDVCMLGDVSCTAKPILITAPTPEDAAAIVAALNGTKRLFEKLRDLARQAASSPEEEGEEKDEEQEPATQGEEVDGKHPKGGRIVAVLLKNITEKRLRKRKCRLILRNLSFQATEENISSKLIVFGPLTEVAIARVPVDTGARRDEKSSHRRHNRGGDGVLMKSRGFAFVTFLCESDAKEAVENSSKLRICNREFALDFCESKDRHAASEVTGGNAAGVSASDTSGNASQGNDKDQEKMEEMESSDVEAEDDSSSSSMEEEASDDDDDDAEVDDAEVYGGDDDDAVEEDDDDEGAGEEEEEAGLEDKDENREEVTPKKKSGVTQDVTEGCTVFVRDLPFDATEDDLKSVFRSFGKLRFAVFVKDKETGMHRGSAFVKFLDSAAAQRAIAAAVATSYSFNSYSNQRKLQGEKDKTGKASIAQEVSEPLMVRGKACRVDLAIDRNLAQRLDEDRSAAAASKDRRNLYLSNEGLETGNVALETEMPERDVEKRKRAHAEKRKKLQNPLFFVSATRLCVRNLKKTVTDKEFRDLCLAATAEGLRRGRVSAQDMEAQLMAQGLSARDRLPDQLVVPSLIAKVVASPLTPMGGVSIVGSTYLKCVRAKVMLDGSRLRGGEAQSRGYGFVEFGHHGHALACLRQLNNNTEYLKFTASPSNQDVSKRSRLIVEFSLENTRKVAILKKRLESKRSHSTDGPKPRDNDGDDASEAEPTVDAGVNKNRSFKRNTGDEGKDFPRTGSGSSRNGKRKAQDGATREVGRKKQRKDDRQSSGGNQAYAGGRSGKRSSRK